MGAVIPISDEWSRPGPKTGLTPKLVEAISKLVREGVKPLRAAIALGVEKRDWYRWKEKARAGVDPYHDRIADIEVAEATYLCEGEMALGRAARLDWKAAESMLKSRLPSEYGQRAAIASDEPPTRDLDLDELIAEAERLGLPTKIFTE